MLVIHVEAQSAACENDTKVSKQIIDRIDRPATEDRQIQHAVHHAIKGWDDRHGMLTRTAKGLRASGSALLGTAGTRGAGRSFGSAARL